jgi:uncharacterized membrane protein SpoIIM required for sporulation
MRCVVQLFARAGASGKTMQCGWQAYRTNRLRAGRAARRAPGAILTACVILSLTVASFAIDNGGADGAGSNGGGSGGLPHRPPTDLFLLLVAVLIGGLISPLLFSAHEGSALTLPTDFF